MGIFIVKFLLQYIGWYEDPSVGGLSKTVQDMISTDPNFGNYVHTILNFNIFLCITFIFKNWNFYKIYIWEI